MDCHQSISQSADFPELCFLETMLKCGICQDMVQQPMRLQCDHIFCRTCLKPLHSGANPWGPRANGYRCPVCREITPSDGLKRDRIANQLTEFVQTNQVARSKSHSNLGQSKESQPTTYQSFSEHSRTWSSTSDLGVRLSTHTELNDNCPVHENEKAQFFCEQCHVLMCNLCNGSTHKHHSSITANEAETKIRDQFCSDVTSLKRTCDLNEQLAAKLREEIDRLDREYDKINKQIEERCQALIERILQDSKDAKKNVERIRSRQMEDVNRSLKTTDAMVASQREAMARFDEVLASFKETPLLKLIQYFLGDNITGLNSLVGSELPNDTKAHAEFRPIRTKYNYLGEVLNRALSQTTMIPKSLTDPCAFDEGSSLTIEDNVLPVSSFCLGVEKLYGVRFSGQDILLQCVEDNTAISVDFPENMGTPRAVVKIYHNFYVASNIGVFQVSENGLVKSDVDVLTGDISDLSVENGCLYAFEATAPCVHVLRIFLREHAENLRLVDRIELKLPKETNTDSFLVSRKYIYFTTTQQSILKFDHMGSHILTADFAVKHKCLTRHQCRTWHLCAIDASDNILIADESSNSLKVVDCRHTQKFSLNMNSDLSNPTGAAFHRGHLYVAQRKGPMKKFFYKTSE